MSLDTFMDNWHEFDARHPEHARLAVGGMTWGFLRAIAECPNCPGVFRVVLRADGGIAGKGDDWEYLHCTRCGRTWQWQPPEEKAEKPTRKKRRVP